MSFTQPRWFSSLSAFAGSVLAMAAPGCASSGTNPTEPPSSAGSTTCGNGSGPSCADATGGTQGGTNSNSAAGAGGVEAGGVSHTGGTAGANAESGTSGTGEIGGAGGTGGGGTGAGGANCTGPIGKLSGALATGIAFMDTEGQRVNAHGGGIIEAGGTYYLHGERFLSTTTDNNFYGFSMYSSKDLATWKNEGIILPQQPSGELGPKRKGERPHIIRCPTTGEYVLYAHAASEDYQTDKEVVYATSPTVNGQYAYKGPLKSASEQLAVHSDISAYADEAGAYVLAESGRVYTLASDCHSWTTVKSFSAVNGPSGGVESPTVFKADKTYYWVGSYKTGWRANNNFYSTAPSVLGPWTYQGYIAPVKDPNNSTSDERTWLSQSTWVLPVVGCEGTVYVYMGDHWDGTQSTQAPGRNNYLATLVLQPFVFDGIRISMPKYHAEWTINVGAGTWSP
jgi:hypothetical protein